MSNKRRDGLETRGRLLDAARAIFADKGFRDATTAEICRRAKATIAAVNYHFGGKERLYWKRMRCLSGWRNAIPACFRRVRFFGPYFTAKRSNGRQAEPCFPVHNLPLS
jgi:AcrR family transcriptional regulator